jgi:hypothetical protein
MSHRNPKPPAVDAGEPARFIRARNLHASRDGDGPQPQIHASESAAVSTTTRSSPLATLLAGHVLRDGETVLLVLKPSLWFIVFQSILFAAAVALGLLFARVFGDQLKWLHRIVYIEAAIFLVAGRVMWAVLQWMGRLYVLTDQRVIRMAGVFSVDLYDCPLRKIARTEITYSVKERLCRIGSIEIYPKEGDDVRNGFCVGSWQTISQPIEVHEQIVAAIRRAQNGG